MIRKILSQSALVGVFGLIAGFFHYLYLATAIKRLDVTSLAQLNTYLSWFQISLCIPALIQSFVVLRAPRPSLLVWVEKVQWIVGLFIGVGFVFLFLNQQAFTLEFFIPWVLFFSFLCFCFFNFWLGVFQGRRFFLFFSILGLLLGVIKFSGVLFVKTLPEFVSVIFISVFLSIFLVLFLKKKIIKNPLFLKSTPEVSITRIRVDLVFSFLVGFFLVLLPNYDVLIVRYLLGLESAGEYSRIQIFTKIIFFAPMILLQITLPYYVSEFRQKSSPSILGHIRGVEILGFLGSLILCLLFGWLGPIILSTYFSISGFTFEFIFFGCLSVLPTYLFMSAVQIFAAARNLKKVLFVLGAIFILPIFVYLFSVQSVLIYLKCAVVIQFLIAFWVFYLTQKEIYK